MNNTCYCIQLAQVLYPRHRRSHSPSTVNTTKVADHAHRTLYFAPLRRRSCAPGAVIPTTPRPPHAHAAICKAQSSSISIMLNSFTTTSVCAETGRCDYSSQRLQHSHCMQTLDITRPAEPQALYPRRRHSHSASAARSSLPSASKTAGRTAGRMMAARACSAASHSWRRTRSTSLC